jgi:hypothetical protein
MHRPTTAAQEMRGHTLEEIYFAKELKSSVDDFFKTVSGEKKWRSAKESMLELMGDAEETENDE